MEATLKFDLNDFDDRIAHLRCVKALDLAIALWEIRTNLKRECENAIENKEIDKYEALEIFFEKLNDVFEENSIIIDDLII